MDAFVECTKGRGEWAEAYAAEFDAIEPAIDWLKNHRTELVVGSVVVIAGVTFAVMAEISPGMLPEIQLEGACR
ncbi:hypothetical protein F0U59_43380 [Archangium gephyra]|nr:hypothetical protein F0U59_43380 [Archangium gephyra]